MNHTKASIYYGIFVLRCLRLYGRFLNWHNSLLTFHLLIVCFYRLIFKVLRM
ncbi:hypothetical protein M408DRAFT_231412 [Serendipita vermifera MAFF 305830]|uniref:Uncharacterized protein n=1 Tax=Serendipita vermifera MAFF 305830 TaxID=933852 RepID=A0A0C3AX68_SERVB|nr:hypothetical protein M408DRAFT_231412 [Serendipita vermifera MAFF 305830]